MGAFYRHFLYEKILWFDISLNVWLLNGNAHESISQRAAWSRTKVWGCVVCRILDMISKGHCDRAVLAVNRDGNREG